MSLTKQDLSFPALTAQALAFTIMDGSDPLNLSGAAITFRAGNQPGIAAQVQKTNTDSGIEVVDAAAGTITVNIASDDIDDSGMYFFNIDVTPNGGTLGRYISGRIVVTPGLAPAA